MMLSQVEEMRDQLRPSERKLADYVIEAPREVLDLSMTEVAARAGVSQPTIARFCHALGFSGFREFKIRCGPDRPRAWACCARSRVA